MRRAAEHVDGCRKGITCWREGGCAACWCLVGVDSLPSGPADLDGVPVQGGLKYSGVARPSWDCLLPVRCFCNCVPALLAVHMMGTPQS